jgi:hypothetical protein
MKCGGYMVKEMRLRLKIRLEEKQWYWICKNS